MDDGLESYNGSAIIDPMVEQYEVNPDDGDDADEEPPEIPDDGDEEEEMNYYDHFTRLNLNAMTSDWSFTQGGPEEFPSNDFEVGQQFGNKEEVMLVVKQYNIRRAAEYKIVESDHLRLDSNVIAQHIFTMVKADPTISIRILQGGVENHFGYKASYRKVWLAKQKVIARIYGDWEESYNELPRWLFAIQMYLLAFKYCKPLISIDGTHLYGKYGGTLLMAIAQDNNANILPITFAVVEGETKEAWSFFLSYLRKHVKPQPGVLVISDRHKSIDGALNVEGSLWKPPHAFQVFCTRHIAANFMTHFKNKYLKKVLINAAYSKSHREFAHYYGRLRGENVAITNWVEKMPRSQWAQYADEGRRFGHMTTNIFKCINAVMKGSCNLPIMALVKLSYFHLGELFARKGSEALAQLQVGAEFSQTLMKAIEFNSKHVNTMNIYQFDRSRTNFMVEELAAVPGSRQQNYQVLLDERKYYCGYFQALHIPCRHMFVACSHARLDWKQFVHPMYRMESVFNVYRSEFRSIGHDDDWSSYDGPRIWPNPRMMRVKRGRAHELQDS
ncbi:uncharacterized protein LOC130948349 [Arachis stenosperma]|uniref:uncharacterized protein LOC130948349 n=1 Tax=Arachis stenosperma TaxID=217475 RepID=UPI0025AD5C29|nr:uncharacterized protein LOC130948349 [Arachis stenosperma]